MRPILEISRYCTLFIENISINHVEQNYTIVSSLHLFLLAPFPPRFPLLDQETPCPPSFDLQHILIESVPPGSLTMGLFQRWSQHNLSSRWSNFLKLSYFNKILRSIIGQFGPVMEHVLEALCIITTIMTELHSGHEPLAKAHRLA